MIKILFVCHGNICRSPMAECIMKDLVRERSSQFLISSAATSTEEIGNPIHPGTRRKLSEHGVTLYPHRAVQLTRQDYELYDWILGMDQANIRNIFRIIGSDPKGKVRRLLDFTSHPRDIADPWYTGDFDITYQDISEGCTALLQALE